MREAEPTVKRRLRLCGTEQAGCFAQNCTAACVDQGCGRLMRIKRPQSDRLATAAAAARRRLPHRHLSVGDRHRCVADLMQGLAQLGPVRLGGLDLYPVRFQVDSDLGARVDRADCLGDAVDAMPAGHVLDFEGDHLALSLVFDELTFILPTVGGSSNLGDHPSPGMSARPA